MTLRQAIQRLLDYGELDEPLMVRILTRDQDGAVIKAEIGEVTHVQALRQTVCVEKSNIVPDLNF